ncbi:MAG TPA: S46 family peptidase, partial [Bacteroidales bacterium]|nr:S46 family peptidase [Bacteroidales bacterium]
MNKKILVLLLALSVSGLARADEGMWLPFLVEKLNIKDMKQLGCRLTPEQIYSINQASLKDAIVRLDGGSCTGEMISSQGLLLTNHHCGYDDIRANSSVEHDYLTHGFWAMNRQEELPNPGKTASFLVRMEDVTDRVMDSLRPEMSENERTAKVRATLNAIREEAIGESHYEAAVQEMLEGNAYYLFVYETFMDVRLVGAPPSAIGNFGGDTDNWMWPRHTGDFTIFRVYAGPDGKPAEYSKDNLPYQPKHHLPVSLQGVRENDFAMIMGYPGSTDRNLPSWGIEMKIGELNPAGVALRGRKMEIIKSFMDADPALRIKYASKYEYLGNFWKKDAEEAKALKQLKVAEEKRALEQAFDAWAQQDVERKHNYNSVISDMQKVYASRKESRYSLLRVHFIETLVDANLVMMGFQSSGLQQMLAAGQDVGPMAEGLKEAAAELYKDYDPRVDQQVLAAMLKAWEQGLPSELHPSVMAEVRKKYKGDYARYLASVYSRSVLAGPEKFMAFLEKPSAKVLSKDPGFALVNSIMEIWGQQRAQQKENSETLGRARRLFLAGLQEMNPGKSYYPDANSTMRLTYGSVKPYEPRDAVAYDYMTWLDGVIEKEDPGHEDFIV